MHEAATRRAALDLIAPGLNDCEVSRRLGRTVRDWRINQNGSARSICLRRRRSTSPVVFARADYSELLGLFLGDGPPVSSAARGKKHDRAIELEPWQRALVAEARSRSCAA